MEFAIFWCVCDESSFFGVFAIFGLSVRVDVTVAETETVLIIITIAVVSVRGVFRGIDCVNVLFVSESLYVE